MADRSRAWYRYADETGHKAREFDNSARTDAWLLWSCTTQRTSDRGENAEYIFTVGNARPLDQAVQHATTEMLRWLQEDYSLDTTSASLLLGQCVEYDLGNVFDPAYTMVCKLRKALLRFS
jgi:acetamidase/formamidase